MDWCASQCAVVQSTVRKWVKEAGRVEASGVTGPKAARWIKFAALYSSFASAVSGQIDAKIAGFAWADEDPKQWAALTRLQDRTDRQLESTAPDEESDDTDFMAQFTQDELDKLTPEELDELMRHAETLKTVITRRNEILARVSSN